MSVAIEALYIFEDTSCILEHIYAARPPSPQDLITSIRSHASPIPPVLYLSNLVPASTAYSITHGNLVLICTSSKEAPALAILEFLNRVVDIFEDFLGSPLLRAKIEESYEIVAQILSEICDGGIICNTEPNALREQIEITSGLGKLFTQVGIPTSSTSSASASSSLVANLKAASTTANGPAIPWRRSNVRHTSNELYVDIVENVSVVFAPSGQAISARAQGSILFTSKISGVPDLLLALTAPGGTSISKSAGISRTMQLPTFHPCVRLSHWKDHPGDLSFVPPDGRFMLAGYESDLLPSPLDTNDPPTRAEKVFLPAAVDLCTKLGRSSADFEARLTLNTSFPGIAKPTPGRASSSSTPFSFGPASTGSSTAPTLENVSVTIPFPPDVRNVTELKPSRGNARFDPLTKTVEWRIPTKDGASLSGTATCAGNVVGLFTHEDGTDEQEANAKALSEYYDSSAMNAYEHDSSDASANSAVPKKQAKPLMPRSVAVSFNVKGWLASGIRVESLMVDVKRSRGLGEGVRPYKGVKYMTISRRGVERRVGERNE